MTHCHYPQVDADGVQNPLTVLPTRLGLSVRAIDGPPTVAAVPAAGGGSSSYSQLATGSAPFQSTPGGEEFQVNNKWKPEINKQVLV